MQALTKTAAAAAALLAMPAAAQPGGASPEIGGLWGSTMGQLEFNVTDRRDTQGRLVVKDVVAPYTRQPNSKVKGELRGGRLTGYWTEPSSSVQCRTARDGTRYWGRVAFDFDAGGENFDGKWGYCEEAPDRGWSGQREGPSRMASAGQGYASGAAASSQPGMLDVSGPWTSTFGETNFTVTDRRNAQGRVIARSVVGPYKGESGTLKGDLAGNLLSGYWTEPSSSVQCRTARDGTRYWGRIAFTFDPAGDRWDGKWGYCEEAPQRGWSGQRVGRANMAAGGQGYAPAASSAQAALPAQGGGCGQTAAAQPQSAGRSILGALGRAAAGAVLDRGLSRMGVPYTYGLRSTVYNGLMDGIACLLSPRERQQAVQATEQVVQRGVGATREWQSADRPGVTGSSTVTAQNTRADGSLCRTVNDVVIVNGEETTVQKQMCRAPGATGFTLVT